MKKVIIVFSYILYSNFSFGQQNEKSETILEQIISGAIPIDSFAVSQKKMVVYKPLKKILDSLVKGKFKITSAKKKYTPDHLFFRKRQYQRLFIFSANYSNIEIMCYHHGGVGTHVHLAILKIREQVAERIENYVLPNSDYTLIQAVNFFKANPPSEALQYDW
jgi:hypothetical protein